MIAATASAVDRARSVSSMRSRNLPPWWRAKSQLDSAVRALPICRNPVGEGAKRTTTVIALRWPPSYPSPLAGEGMGGNSWVVRGQPIMSCQGSTISTLGQLVVEEHLAQARLHDFAGRGVGQLVEHNNVFGDHPMRKTRCQKRDQIVALWRALRARRHDQQG